MKRLFWIKWIQVALLLFALSYAPSATSQERFPLLSVFSDGFGGRMPGLPREGQTIRKVIDSREIGFPVKDVVKLSLERNENGLKLRCLFRFGANYDYIKARLDSLGAYGPASIRYNRGKRWRWYLPKECIELTLSSTGESGPNRVANYEYTINDMHPVTRSQFFIGKDGGWDRMPFAGVTVLIRPVALFLDEYRTMRGDIKCCDELAEWVTQRVLDNTIHLSKYIPRKTLPSKGEVFYDKGGSALFPFGFLGRVSSVRLKRGEYLVTFEEVDEMDVFDVNREAELP